MKTRYNTKKREEKLEIEFYNLQQRES